MGDASTSTQRHLVGISNNNAADPAMVRMGAYNNAANNYVVTYWTTTTQTVATGVVLSTGWHAMSLTMDYVAKTITWKIDNTSGTISNPNLTKPANGLVNIQTTYGGNGAAGAPDTSAWVDNVAFTPEPATLALLASGLIFVRRRRTA